MRRAMQKPQASPTPSCCCRRPAPPSTSTATSKSAAPPSATSSTRCRASSRWCEPHLSSPAKCSARGHSLHLFGDMVDTFGITQVDRRDLMRSEEYSEPAIGIEWTNGKPLTTKGLRDLPQSTLEGDIGLRGGDGADDLVLVVIHPWQAVRHCPRTGTVAACRHVVAQCLMRPIEIVDGPPLVKRALDIGKVPVAPEGEHLGLQRSMEAFVLSSALRMIRPAVDHPDAKLQKPDRQHGPRVFKGEAPRAAIVDEHGIGQPVTVECRLQMPAYRRALFVVTGSQTQRESRVIVQHRQWVTGHAVLQRTVSLEVHLPELVGRFLLEANVRLSRRARRLRHATVPAQDLVHRRYRRHGLPVALQAMCNLARSPGRVGIAQSHDPLLDRSCGAIRTVMRPPRLIRQRRIARIVPLNPLVSDLDPDTELLPQLPPGYSILPGKHYELSSLVHDRHLSPRHGSPPCSTNPANFDVSTMSPNTRQSCPRAEHFARNDGLAATFALQK